MQNQITAMNVLSTVAVPIQIVFVQRMVFSMEIHANIAHQMQMEYLVVVNVKGMGHISRK